MKESLRFFAFLAGAAVFGGTFVYLLDCAFGDNLRAWLGVNPEVEFVLLAMLTSSLIGFIQGICKKEGQS